MYAEPDVHHLRGMYVVACVEMVERLPDEVRFASRAAVRQACLEAWCINVRLLLEFLLVREPNRRDFSARDYGWQLPASVNKECLTKLWTECSQFVAHFSKSRVDAGATANPWRCPEFQACMTDRLLALYEEFLVYLENDPIWSGYRDWFTPGKEPWTNNGTPSG